MTRSDDNVFIKLLGTSSKNHFTEVVPNNFNNNKGKACF